MLIILFDSRRKPDSRDSKCANFDAHFIELKNQFSGQSVDNAKKQYVYDREPSEPIFLFKKRTLVHFAVDTDECFMTTKLDGKRTRYLPFNKGNNN